jgi:uncharacterized membrane protein YadS
LIVGLSLILVCVVIVSEVDGAISGFFKAQLGEKQKNPFEYPLVAAVLGLIVNFMLRAIKAHDFIKPAIRTELFLKIGLVLMGARIAFGDILAKGAGGLIQALIMVSSVFFFTWWLAGSLKISDTLKAVMATAVSILCHSLPRA